MSLFKSVDLARISFAPGEYVRGRWEEGAETRTPFAGTWQPANGKNMEKLPEGKRSNETYKCFAPIEMEFTAADPEKQVSGDRIEKDGARYEVTLAAKWDNALIPHWELLCQREKEGER